MPRSDKATRSARQHTHKTLSALSAALGVHRNTPPKWRDEGCPLGEAPYDELSVRIWAAAQGHDCPGEPEQALAEKLAAAGVRGYTAIDQRGGDIDQVLELLPGRSKYDRAVQSKAISYAEAEARERTVKLELANDQQRRHEAERRGQLVPASKLLEVATILRDRLDHLGHGFGRRVIARCGDLDRSIAALVITAADAEARSLLDALDRGVDSE